jgi:hypothetical protein
MLGTTEIGAHELAVIEVKNERMVLPWDVRWLAIRNGEHNQLK